MSAIPTNFEAYFLFWIKVPFLLIHFPTNLCFLQKFWPLLPRRKTFRHTGKSISTKCRPESKYIPNSHYTDVSKFFKLKMANWGIFISLGQRHGKIISNWKKVWLLSKAQLPFQSKADKTFLSFIQIIFTWFDTDSCRWIF